MTLPCSWTRSTPTPSRDAIDRRRATLICGGAGEAGRARAAIYTWERTAELMAGVYVEVAGGSL